MLAKLIVLSPEDYELWSWGKKIELPPAVGVGARPQPPGLVAGSRSRRNPDSSLQLAMLGDTELPSANLVQQGEKLARTAGCVACHSAEDRPGIGPSYFGLFGREVVLSDGTRVIADENYIRESIENPQAKIVKGYENVLMPPYPGLLTELELNALIAYIKSLEN
jgi:cytochrome c oxidase subunit 2